MSHCIHIIADESLASRTAEMLEAQCGISTTLSYLCQCPTGVLDSVVNMPRSKVTVIPQQAEVAQGVPGRLRPRDFLDVRHYKGGRSSAIRTGRLYSLAEAESTSRHILLSGGATEKIPSDTTGNRSWDRPTGSAVP